MSASPFPIAAKGAEPLAVCLHAVRQAGVLVGVDAEHVGELLDVVGVLLRPLGNTVYVMPPYCVTDDDMDEIWGAIASYR